MTNDQTRKNRTLSYEINRTLTNTTRSPGTILGLTAAVFIARAHPPPAAPRPARAPKRKSPPCVRSWLTPSACAPPPDGVSKNW